MTLEIVDEECRIFRRCPGCRTMWPRREGWLQDTEPSGSETRVARYQGEGLGREGVRFECDVEVAVRRHTCGGLTLDEGICSPERRAEVRQ